MQVEWGRMAFAGPQRSILVVCMGSDVHRPKIALVSRRPLAMGGRCNYFPKVRGMVCPACVKVGTIGE